MAVRARPGFPSVATMLFNTPMRYSSESVFFLDAPIDPLGGIKVGQRTRLVFFSYQDTSVVAECISDAKAGRSLAVQNSPGGYVSILPPQFGTALLTSRAPEP